MKCERCGSTNVISITVQLGDGSPLTFSTCHYCEDKKWTSRKGSIPLTKVLEMASTSRPR